MTTTVTTTPAVEAPPDPAAGEVLHAQAATLLAALAYFHDQEQAPDQIAAYLSGREVLRGGLRSTRHESRVLRGLRGSRVTHPLARCLTAELGTGAIAWLSGPAPDLEVVRDDAHVRLPLPPTLAEFVRRFDAGEYPALELPLPELRELVAAAEPEPDEVEVEVAACRVCGCTEASPCQLEWDANGLSRWAYCRWATDEEMQAAGVEPMDGDLCTNPDCLPPVSEAAQEPEQQNPAAALGISIGAGDQVALAQATLASGAISIGALDQADTVTIPAVPAAAGGDSGRVLVRVAVLCGLGAAAAFALAAGPPWDYLGTVLALAWPVVAVLLLRRREAYEPRHRPGCRPVHAVGRVPVGRVQPG